MDMQGLRGVIFDIDGVLEYQGRVYPGAVETVAQLRRDGLKLCFLTNSTLKSRAACAAKLCQKGFEVREEEVITASYATAQYLKALHPRSIWVLLQREGLDEFKGFSHDENDPEYVVIGDYREQFNFTNLNKALRALHRGAHLVGMISELVDSSMGELELNVGAWVRLMELTSGVSAIYVGKPNRYVFDLALNIMGLPKDQVIMVGDRVGSDVVGAHGSDISSVLLRSGEFNPHDLEMGIQPDYIFDSVQELLSIVEG